MTLNKKLVAAATCTALTVGLGMQAAQATSILFPYLSTQAGVYSFVTIVNNNQDGSLYTGYHMSYAHKTMATPFPNASSCNHLDGNTTTTMNDMMTFEVGGKVLDAGSPVLFESAAPITSTALTLSGLSNQIAFLIVEPTPVGPQGAGRANLYGWADVIDTASNMTLNYSTDFLNNIIDNDPNFINLDAATGWRAAQWYPPTYVTTAWHILPLGTRAAMAPAGGGGLSAGLFATVNNANTLAAYNRDEAGFSGSYSVGVKCFGIIDTASVLMPGVIANTTLGGTMMLEDVVIAGPPAYAALPFLAHKIQTATPAAGVGLRVGINREPSAWPAFAP